MHKPLVAALVAGALVLSACGGKSSDPTDATPPTSQTGGTTGTDSNTTPPTPGNTTPTPDPAPQPEPPPPPEPPKVVKREVPTPSRGIHLSGWYAGSPDLSGPLMEWCKQAGLNTLVLDIKAEDGKLSWNSDVPLAEEIGANLSKIGDLPKFIQQAHDMGFWVAGRIVVMNDASLYAARPDWGIPGFPGGPYSFMDPRNENVWQYNLDIAKSAVKAGVDEIQWDYIRYPEKLVDGYNKNTTAEYRTEPIIGFLKRSVDELKPMGVYVSADIFGLTTSVAEGDDMEIGQDYRKVMETVDFVSAMVYPSHYNPNTYGLPDPNSAPYETVKKSMEDAIKRTPGMDMAKHRPWIQDFSLHGVAYGPNEVLAQVRALDELGIKSFLLWDPSNKYSREANFN